MTREQAQQIAEKAMVEAGIPCTDAASKIADILMESAKPKVPFEVGQKILILWHDGEIIREEWHPNVDIPRYAQGNVAPDTPEGRKALELEARRRAFRAKPRKQDFNMWLNAPRTISEVGNWDIAFVHLADILGLTWATREEAEANQKEAMELFWEGMWWTNLTEG
jgi:predicted RNase H-like HicB family nuclease